MLICAQPGRISGLEKETDPASSARSNKKVLKDNNNRLCGTFIKFCIPFGTKSKKIICGGGGGGARQCLHCSDPSPNCEFPRKHLNSGIEQSRRGIILLVLLFI